MTPDVAAALRSQFLVSRLRLLAIRRLPDTILDYGAHVIFTRAMSSCGLQGLPNSGKKEGFS
jgi:hypothetical protein